MNDEECFETTLSDEESSISIEVENLKLSAKEAETEIKAQERHLGLIAQHTASISEFMQVRLCNFIINVIYHPACASDISHL